MTHATLACRVLGASADRTPLRGVRRHLRDGRVRRGVYLVIPGPLFVARLAIDYLTRRDLASTAGHRPSV